MLAIPDLGNTGGRPPRDPRVQAYAAGGLRGQLMMQDSFGYAGDDANPRPLPKRTLGSFKRQFSAYFEARDIAREQRAPDAFHLAFCSDRLRLPLEDAIPVPREDLWWLAAPNDLLLLSDRITHHYTTAHRVAPESARLYLLDDWPDRIFLKEGLNSAGVCATVTPYFAGVLDDIAPARKEVGIGREEYLRVAVGLITQDTPALIERYFAHRPAALSSFPINLAFGLALLDVPRDALARHALPCLRRALQIARDEHDATREDRAAAALHVALQLAGRRAHSCGDALAGKPFSDLAAELTSRYGEDRLMAALDVEQLCRLANAAAWSQDFDTAGAWLRRALAIDPGHEGALGLTTKLHLRLDDPAAALESAGAALAANARRREALAAERDARDPRDRWGRADDEARLGGLRALRADEHADRANALIRLQRFAEARADAEQAMAGAPEAADGYRHLATIEAAAGQIAKACEALQQAISRERGPRERANMVGLLEQLRGHQRAQAAGS